jgi:RNA polymerase sigma factor (sigma-70 family)
LSESILERVAAGDAHAIEACLDRYGGLVLSLARRLCKDPGDVEDAVQEAFIGIWQAAPRFDPAIAPEAAFVAMVARRRIIDRRRRDLRRPPGAALEEIGELAAMPPPPPRADLTDEANRVRAAFDRLDGDRRRVLELAVLRGLSHDGIAKVLAMPLGTVKSHARRGLLAVRRMLTGDSLPRGEVGS